MPLSIPHPREGCQPPSLTAKEIADLTGKSVRWIQLRAKRERWTCETEARNGGATATYRLDDLPADIRAIILEAQEQAPAEPGAASPPQGVAKRLWREFAKLDEASRALARKRADTLARACGLQESEGISFNAAATRAVEGESVTVETARKWRERCEGLPRRLWAPALASRHAGGGRAAEIDDGAFEAFKADYMRPEGRSLADCHRDVSRLAVSRGWTVPADPRALLRRLEAEVPRRAIVLARQGREALDRMSPPQIRDRGALASMEIVCADGHRWDVLAEWPDGTVARPVMVAWQDIRSGKILAWRIGPEETSDLYRLSCADMLWVHGAPVDVIVDNGRGIAAKCLTGGTPTRYRGKILDEDPVGLLTQLVGPKHVHWTIPYSGQSKLIERAFRDFASGIATDSRLAGAYTGKDTVSKPHNYGAKKIPLERFREVVADGIAQYNARPGRRGRGMDGRSCDDVFAACLPASGLDKLEPDELACWLLAAKSVTAHKENGSVTLFGARYWSEELSAALAMRPKNQRQVVVRFDPERLDRDVRVERPDGRMIGFAGAQEPVPYLSAEKAEKTIKLRASVRKAAKAERDAAVKLSSAELAALVDSCCQPEGAAAPGVLELEIPAVPARAAKAAAGASGGGSRPADGRSEHEKMIDRGHDRILRLAGVKWGG